MVYLERVGAAKEESEKSWELVAQMRDFYRQCPEVKVVEILYPITGPINELRIRIGFESLADEEKWSLRVRNDPEYVRLVRDSTKLTTVPVDYLYRTVFE
jgi:hypothetical protein